MRSYLSNLSLQRVFGKTNTHLYSLYILKIPLGNLDAALGPLRFFLPTRVGSGGSHFFLVLSLHLEFFLLKCKRLPCRLFYYFVLEVHLVILTVLVPFYTFFLKFSTSKFTQNLLQEIFKEILK